MGESLVPVHNNSPFTQNENNQQNFKLNPKSPTQSGQKAVKKSNKHIQDSKIFYNMNQDEIKPTICNSQICFNFSPQKKKLNKKNEKYSENTTKSDKNQSSENSSEKSESNAKLKQSSDENSIVTSSSSESSPTRGKESVNECLSSLNTNNLFQALTENLVSSIVGKDTTNSTNNLLLDLTNLITERKNLNKTSIANRISMNSNTSTWLVEKKPRKSLRNATRIIMEEKKDNDEFDALEKQIAVEKDRYDLRVYKKQKNDLESEYSASKKRSSFLRKNVRRITTKARRDFHIDDEYLRVLNKSKIEKFEGKKKNIKNFVLLPKSNFKFVWNAIQGC